MSGRPTAARRMYGARWQRARFRFLRANPLCVRCLKSGRTEAANTVDHTTPHRGDETLFWSEDNWQALCSTCHSGDKQKQERSGATQYRGCTLDGTPLDPEHHWSA